MREETTVEFNMSAVRVWSLLTDLKGFARWHPTYRIAGHAERGAEMDVTWLLFNGKRMITTQMVINRLIKPQLIGWQMGVRGIVTFDERYDIEPIANGVQVRHSIECRGVLGSLVGPMLRKGLRRTMRLQDAALLALLRRQSRLPAQAIRGRRRPVKPSPPRGVAND